MSKRNNFLTEQYEKLQEIYLNLKKMKPEQILGLTLAVCSTIVVVALAVTIGISSSPGGRVPAQDCLDCAPVDTAFFNSEKDSVYFVTINGDTFSWPLPKK